MNFAGVYRFTVSFANFCEIHPWTLSNIGRSPRHSAFFYYNKREHYITPLSRNQVYLDSYLPHQLSRLTNKGCDAEQMSLPYYPHPSFAPLIPTVENECMLLLQKIPMLTVKLAYNH